MAVRLGEIAEFLKARLQGDASLEIEGPAELKSAGPSHLAFFNNPKYAPLLSSTKAGAIVLSEADASKAPGRSLLISANPYRDFALALAKYFAARHQPGPGIHALACVSKEAQVDPSARIGAFSVVEAGARIAAGAVLFPFAYVGHAAEIGEGCLLHPQSVVLQGCKLGRRVILHSGAVIGSDGFGFAPNPPEGYVKIPQLGIVLVEDDVEIQANACVDRGALGSTVIGQGTKLDNLVHVAHNVKIGRHTVLAGQVGIAGSTEIGNWVTFAGQAAAGGHLKVGDGAIITGQAGIGKDVPPKLMVSGSPAQPTMEHHRGLAEMGRLPELKKRVKALEAKLADLEKKLESR